MSENGGQADGRCDHSDDCNSAGDERDFAASAQPAAPRFDGTLGLLRRPSGRELCGQLVGPDGLLGGRDPGIAELCRDGECVVSGVGQVQSGRIPLVGSLAMPRAMTLSTSGETFGWLVDGCGGGVWRCAAMTLAMLVPTKGG